jgi:class 3 adenylate cyclase/tetratricopeptide (TPR) repeat protein
MKCPELRWFEAKIGATVEQRNLDGPPGIRHPVGFECGPALDVVPPGEKRGGMLEPSPDASEVLRPYVPRFLLDWLRSDPGRQYAEPNGTLAFVDISGFTAMCERLARRGKVGAEEVNDVLDDCFTQLLSIAYEDGGGVVKWGGDAVLLLFTGPEHAPRACRAAYRMRARLRRIGSRLRTSAGFVSLRMSVGIHSGMFQLFLVGDAHRELLITGPGASMTVRMEQTATAGEIALSRETTALIEPRLLGATKDDATLLRAEPADIEFQPAGDSGDLRGLDIAACIPMRISDYLLQGGGEAEHRHVAVGFLEFRGIDALLEQEGLDRTWQSLDELTRCVQRAAREHGVTFFESDISADGGKIMLVAGAPASSGNEEEQMLRACRAIADADLTVPVRMGINSGHVFSGIFGPPYRRTYSIKGDAVNMAARIMGKAELGKVLCSAEAVERSRTLFELDRLEPFRVKGKKEPVEAFSLGSVTGVKAPAGWLQLPIIGRERELDILLEAVDSARLGQGAVAEMVGEPGIGKSRIVQELRARVPDVDAIAATCDPYEASTPYYPFRTLLRTALGISPDAAGDQAGEALHARVASSAPELLPWLPLLATAASADVERTPEVEDLEPEFRKSRLEWVTGELLTRVLPSPTLLIIEDVHWMDEPSVDLLRLLVSLVPERAWTICLTRRDQPTGFIAGEDPKILTLRPAPLSAEEATSLVTAASEDSPLSPHDVAELARRAGGNPLFLQELVSATGPARTVDALPDSVEGLLTVQIDRLAPSDRRVLRYASVLGATFDERLLHAVLALERGIDDGVWTRLSDFLWLDSSGNFRFRHALIRDAAYEGLPFRRRREIHARAGETIELWAGERVHEHAELLSLHFYQAGRYLEAWEYSRLAGHRAERKFANTEAADFYRRAIDSAKRVGSVPDSDLGAVLESLGDVAERAGLYETAAAAYREARRLARTPVQEAELLLKAGLIRERAGRYSDAVAWYRRGLRVLDGATNDPAARSVGARILVWFASSRRQQGRFLEAIEWCERAITEAESSGELGALAHAYRMLDRLFTNLGRPERIRYRTLALAAYEDLGDLAGLSEVLNELGADAYFEGRWSEALDLYGRSTESRRKTGDEVNAAHGTHNIAEILSDQGYLEEAESLFREVLRIWKAAGFRLGIAFATSNLGRVAARSGRHDDADDLYRDALVGFRSKQAEWESLETQARMGENHLLAGRPDEALDIIEPILQRAEGLGGLHVLHAMVNRLRGYALLPDDPEGARRALAKSLESARSVDARYEMGLTLLAQSHLAEVRREDPEPSARQAKAILDALGVVSVALPREATAVQV